ncbi:hypothetical protein ACIPSA_25340 [Streptomyces sp. NPDC086549]|uniref:terpene synthase family protein n=1 Tax=Streptomyces sp. NPDC086549 TaxID=3365752 RepID=UPI00381A5F02
MIDFGPTDVCFAVPFPAGISPDADAAGTHLVDWFDRMRISDRGEVQGAAPFDPRQAHVVGLWSGMCYPQARGEVLNLITCFNGLWLVFDDRFKGPHSKTPATVAPVADRITGRLYQPDRPDPMDALESAAADLLIRLRQRTSPVWYARFAGHLERFLAGLVSESLARDHSPTIEDYLGWRRWTIGTWANLDLVETAIGYDVPPSVYHAPAMRELRHAAADAVIGINDVFSLPNDQAGQDPNNLVLRCRAEHGVDRDAAVEWVRRHVERAHARFQRAAARVPFLCDDLRLDEEHRAGLGRYIEGAGQLLRGIHDVHLVNPRYRS